jgi:hypothetical protein
MNSQTVLKRGSEYDFSECKISENKKISHYMSHSNAAKFYDIHDENGNKVALQTPIMKCPFGLSSYIDKCKSMATSFELNLSFSENMSTEEQQFCNNMKKLDDRILNLVAKDTKSILGKRNIIAASIRSNYSSLLKESHNYVSGEKNAYPPRIKTKILFNKSEQIDDKSEFITNFVFPDGANKNINYVKDNFTKHSSGMAFILMEGFWVINNRICPSVKLIQFTFDKQHKKPEINPIY